MWSVCLCASACSVCLVCVPAPPGVFLPVEFGALPLSPVCHKDRIAGASTVHCVPDSERLADMGGSRGGRRNGRAAVGDADDTAVAAAPLLAAPVDMVSMLEAVAANPLLRQSHVRSVPGS